ncbi:DNA replication initiation factor cdc45 [Niveomyces insectorum RCEF 264]|uniref:DNA replication initiation factor cdc45 n=1 Tax=Niveomyces insectorum RCEF 264 TaxID=1081102 RepID=A0A168A982_9HYPO|nr:DNA replication initiation factor cdc45 [Niveomyces insectorum RCEF 264]
MGVPRLLSTLEPYAERKPLDGAQVIIDGPGLAYHAVNLCRADSSAGAGKKGHPLDSFSYDQLGQAALALLDELRRRGVTMSLRDIFVSYQRDNVPGFDAKDTQSNSRSPAPAFTVPAVLDALHQSPIYGPLTSLVPGEADTFCAGRARAADSGTVLTSDSDLLVQDLGSRANVVLFRDIDPRRRDADKPLIVPTYSPAKLCQRLALRPGNGMRALAFELFLDPHLSLGKLVERANREAAITTFPREYAAFAEQYAHPGQLAQLAKTYDTAELDPRLSEFVLQCLFPLHRGNEGREGGTGLGPDNSVLVFVPQLLEDWTRTNAWEVSTPLRQCAYSLQQLVAPPQATAVREYTRRASLSSRGTQVELLSLPQIHGAVGAFTACLRRIQTQTETDHDLQWVILAAHLDIEWSRNAAKESVCLTVLCNETPADGVLDRVTWNTVHWLSQIQATLYSLRLLKQMLEFVLREADEKQLARLAPILSDLHEMLSSVTPIADYPTLQTLQRLPARLKQAGALELLSDLGNLTKPIQFSAGPKQKQKSKEATRKRKRPERIVKSADRPQKLKNPFSVLDDLD